MSTVGNFTALQVLQMMNDDDFAYLVEFNPDSINHMCISLTVELLEGVSEKKPD